MADEIQITKWQPIGTVPRSGRSVFVWMPYTRPKADVGWWVECVPGCPVCAKWGDTGYVDFDGSDGGHDMQPTHWAPITAPEDAPL